MGPEDRDVLKRIAAGLENQKPTPRFFGLTFRDLCGAVVVLLAIWAFYIRTGDFMERQVKLNEYFSEFAQNSDSYHSAATGTLFQKGQPRNASFDPTFARAEKMKGIQHAN